MKREYTGKLPLPVRLPGRSISNVDESKIVINFNYDRRRCVCVSSRMAAEMWVSENCMYGFGGSSWGWMLNGDDRISIDVCDVGRN